MLFCKSEFYQNPLVMLVLALPPGLTHAPPETNIVLRIELEIHKVGPIKAEVENVKSYRSNVETKEALVDKVFNIQNGYS